jgi:hypothetical protein
VHFLQFITVRHAEAPTLQSFEANVPSKKWGWEFRVGEFPEVLNLESFQESFRKVSGNIGSFVKLCQLHGMALNVFLEMECNGVCDTDTDVVATLAL